MATKPKTITRQSSTNPESAAGQNGKAGPQESLSSYRSSTEMGNLASIDSNATSDSSCRVDINNCCVAGGKSKKAHWMTHILQWPKIDQHCGSEIQSINERCRKFSRWGYPCLLEMNNPAALDAEMSTTVIAIGFTTSGASEGSR
ncbi:hypothetical protein HHI36_003247 [Cryptolaemus montrouzieri]|uniref:Uncharacterized protein n=1 Tax=Cryptolaemus montrouzieri TaxID=559131 RepID=A0ABD2PCW4_9CUCU